MYNKNTNGWISCPSKSFPGKVYYFNVLNGKTTWSLNELDKNYINKNNTENDPNKLPCCPEPSGIPINEEPKPPNAKPDFKFDVTKRYTIQNDYTNQTQTFAQTYTNLISQVDQYIIFAPIKVPVVVPNALPQRMLNPTLDKSETERDLFVRTSIIPLSARFGNLLKRNEPENIEKSNCFSANKCTNIPPDKCQTFDQNACSQTTENIMLHAEIIEKDTIHEDGIHLNRFEIAKCGGHSMKVHCSARFENTSENKSHFENTLEKNSPHFENTLENSVRFENALENYDPCFENRYECSGKRNNDFLVNLDKNDLRFFLMAKRRKLEDLHEKIDTETGGKDCPSEPGNTSGGKETATPKKRVTFNTKKDNNDQDKYTVIGSSSRDPRLNVIKMVFQPAESSHRWFLVADTSTLLEDFQYIEAYVQKDAKCNLLVPRVVLSRVSELSRGDCRGRHHVLAARHIMRRIAARPHYITVQTDTEEGETDLSDSNQILYCCLKMMNQMYYVILITNNQEFYEKATALKLNCIKLEDFKNLKDMKPVLFEKSFKRTIKNNILKESSDVFMQYRHSFLPSMYTNNNSVDNIEGVETQADKHTSILDEETNQTIKDIADNNEIKNIPMENFHITDEKNDLEKKKSSFTNNVSLKNDESSLDNVLKMYSVKDLITEERIKKRIEEWMCCYMQIMEDILCDLLMNHTASSILPPSWSLLDALECIKNIYNNNTSIKIIIDKLFMLMNKCRLENGKLNSDTKADDFMKMIGCGIILVQCLQMIIPKNDELMAAEQSLKTIINNIKDPKMDPNQLMLITPVIRHSDYDEMTPPKQMFEKDKTDVIQYLERHFPDWKSCDEILDSSKYIEDINQPQQQTQEMKVVRTFGRNVNILKINKNKSMTITKQTNIQKDNQNVEKNPVNPNQKKDEQKSMEHSTEIDKLKMGLTETYNQNLNMKTLGYSEIDKTLSILTNLVTQEINENDYGNNDITEYNHNNEIKNSNNNEINISEKYGNVNDITEIMKLNNAADCVQNNYTNNNQDNHNGNDKENCGCDNENSVQNNTNNKDTNTHCDTDFATNNDKNCIISDNVNNGNNDNYGNYVRNDVGDDLTVDSGIENENQQIATVKTFLNELNQCFKFVYNFIKESINEFHKEIQEEKKKLLHDKTKNVHSYVVEIIDNLKSIIQREFSENIVLKDFLPEASPHASTDRRTGYRQVVTKCLKQAQMLENALQMVMCISEWKINAAGSVNEMNYFKIFENLFITC